MSRAPPEGLGDAEDPAHRGFAALRELLDKYHPAYLLHGHIHLRYGQDKTRVREYNGTTLINVSERYELDIPDREHPPFQHNQIIWRTRHKEPVD